MSTCSANPAHLSDSALVDLKDSLHKNWELAPDGKSITRTFTFKGFAKATYTANAAAFLSDNTGHHADIAFGWGYCKITYTTHEADRLSEVDFTCARKLDAMLA